MGQWAVAGEQGTFTKGNELNPAGAPDLLCGSLYVARPWRYPEGDRQGIDNAGRGG